VKKKKYFGRKEKKILDYSLFCKIMTILGNLENVKARFEK